MEKIFGEIPNAAASGAYGSTSYLSAGSEADKRSNKKAEKAAERWCTEWQRSGDWGKGGGISYSEREIDKRITNLRAGPPAFLNEASKAKWEAEIKATVRRCKDDILAPSLRDRLIQRWIVLKEILWKNIRQESRVEGESNLGNLLAIAKGIRNSFKRRKGEAAEHNDIVRRVRQVPHVEPIDYSEREVVEGVTMLKRGEELAPVSSKFTVDETIRGSKDPIVLIARAIYGCRKRVNFVYRNLIKQIDIQENKGEKFESRYVRFKRGGGRKINSFRQYRQILHRQKSWVGKEEFSIITSLYQTQIRIFEVKSNKGGSNMTCIDQIGYNYSRTIDLLEEQGCWRLIHKDKKSVIERNRKDRNWEVGLQKEGVDERSVLEIDKRNEDSKEENKTQLENNAPTGRVMHNIEVLRSRLGEELVKNRIQERMEGGVRESETRSGKYSEDSLSDRYSVDSSVDLVDRHKLEECVREYRARMLGEVIGKPEKGNDNCKISTTQERVEDRQEPYNSEILSNDNHVEALDIVNSREGYSTALINREHGLHTSREAENTKAIVEAKDSNKVRERYEKVVVDDREGKEGNGRELRQVGSWLEDRIVLGEDQKIKEKMQHRVELDDSPHADSSQVDLIDARQLEECMQQYKARMEEKLEKEEEESNGEGIIGANRERVMGDSNIHRISVERQYNKRQTQVEDRERVDSSNDRERDSKEVEQNRRNERRGYQDKIGDIDNSNSIIGILFGEKQVERVEDKIGYRDRVNSEDSSIDLIDARQLEEFMQIYKSKKQLEPEVDIVEGIRDNRELKLIVETAGELGYNNKGRHEQLAEIEEGYKNGRMSREIDSEDRNLGVTEEIRVEEQESVGTRQSYSTTSSIAALFKDKHLEKEGRKVGINNITRRKVWLRWKGIIRGEIRRSIRRKHRIDKKSNKLKEDNKLIFDYTTRGLSVDEVTLLERGEGFCVADYKIDEDRSKVDIYQFQRRLRLHELFRDPGRDEEGEGVSTPVGRRENRISRGGGRGVERVRNTVNSIRSIPRMSTEGRGRAGGSSRLNRVNQLTQGTNMTESRSIQRAEVDSSSSMRGRRSSMLNERDIRNERGRDIRRVEGRGVGRLGENRGENNRQSREVLDTMEGQDSRQGRSRSRPSGGVSRRISRGIDSQDIQTTTGRGTAVRGRVGIHSVSRTGVGRVDGIVGRETQEVGRGIEDRQEGGGIKGEGRRLPSIFDPDSHNRNLNRYNTCIQEEIMLVLEDRKVEFRDNIAKQERVALKLLKQRIADKEIIVTRADKGSGLVALDYDKYILKGTKYIEEEAGAYSKVEGSEQEIIGKLTKDRNKVAEQLKDRGVITQQTATYIKKQLEEKITGIKFYYKIHKDRQIETMPLRPLQSCIKAPMQHLSIVLTDILQPLLIDKNIPSFIFDSNQLLYRLQKLGRIPSNCTLISSDVSALYPSIPHREGFKAMKSFLQEFTAFNNQQLDSIMRALELVITENFMTWNSHIYKQSSGVAMGTPVAVAYANIFMHWVDRQVRLKAAYIHEHIRYIDDNLFILPEDKVEHLMEVANNILPPHIKFTYEKLEIGTEKGLPFLDTQLFIGTDYTIESRLYTKATDRHAYLLPSSYHPPHVTKNIPLAVFGRLRKICSREEWFVEDTKKAVGWLENRGYKKGDIQKALEKTRGKDRWAMIEKIEKNRDKKVQDREGVDIDIPLILTYNQFVGRIRKVLKDRQPLLNSAFRRTKVRPRLSFRRRRNLNDILVQKGLRGPIEVHNIEGNVFKKCGESPGYRSGCPCKGRHSQAICRCCAHSREVLEGIEYKLCRPVSCNTKNVIYVIGCNSCSKKYVGETQQRLKDRLAQHMYNVTKLNQPLYIHFRHVHKLDNMYIGIVEAVKGTEPFMRKVREAWWINRLKTLEPSGFNVKLECNQVYEETG